MTTTSQPTPTSVVPAGEVREYDVPAGSRPHDVAVAPDGMVWYTAQGSGELGRLDPGTGRVSEVALGAGSRPHGVVVGPDGALWVTDGGLNAIMRVDPATSAVRRYELPATRPPADLNTAAFDQRGRLWFTGQAGVYGRLYPAAGRVEVFDAPGGRGPYAITVTPAGDVYYASLRGTTSPASTRPRALSPSFAHRLPGRAPAGCGPTPRDGCGAASGTRDRSPCTTRPTGGGANGGSRASALRPTPCTSTGRTASG